METKKNIKLGSKVIITFVLFFSLNSFYLKSEEKITTTPLINLNQIEPSFEEVIDKNENLNSQQQLKERKKKSDISSSHAVLIGLDKITAKSSEIVINLDEVKKFGPLEIKILKCGKVKLNNKFDDVAYMQVKDLTKSENEKVYIFNGWTFSSDPNIIPFDHAIYDLQLINCNNV